MEMTHQCVGQTVRGKNKIGHHKPTALFRFPNKPAELCVSLEQQLFKDVEKRYKTDKTCEKIILYEHF